MGERPESGFSRLRIHRIFVNVTKYLEYGCDNVLKVEAINSNQPNSRWYSGTGIYRPVWLYLLPENHICLQGIRVTTLDYKISVSR